MLSIGNNSFSLKPLGGAIFWASRIFRASSWVFSAQFVASCADYPPR
jgi:hypothetical protein